MSIARRKGNTTKQPESPAPRVILHGHPKFAVVMRHDLREGELPDQGLLEGLTPPVVAGEIGAGGLAKRVPPVIGPTASAIVYGHGVFTISREGFGKAFAAMVGVENFCREEHFRRVSSVC